MDDQGLRLAPGEIGPAEIYYWTTDEWATFSRLAADHAQHHFDAVLVGDPDADKRPSGIIKPA